MSIKGVDAQIMVARTAEFSKDNTAEARRGELFQNSMAAQGKELEAQGGRTVARTEDIEQVEIRNDERRRGGEDRRKNDRRRQGGRRQAAVSDGELPAGVGQQHKIDIKI